MRMRFWGESTREFEKLVRLSSRNFLRCATSSPHAFHPKARSHHPITALCIFIVGDREPKLDQCMLQRRRCSWPNRPGPDTFGCRTDILKNLEVSPAIKVNVLAKIVLTDRLWRCPNVCVKTSIKPLQCASTSNPSPSQTR